MRNSIFAARFAGPKDFGPEPKMRASRAILASSSATARSQLLHKLGHAHAHLGGVVVDIVAGVVRMKEHEQD